MCSVYNCATSPYREVFRAKGGIGSRETLCHVIYPARPMTTVSLATNTYCMMDSLAHAHLAPWAPGSNLAVRVNRAIDDRPGIQQEAICYQWFKQRLILSVSKPSISQRTQIKEDTVEPSVPAREFNLKAYAAITQGCRGYEISHPYPYPQIFRGYPWIYPYPHMPMTRDIDIANLSVRPSVRYVPVSDENGLTYRHSSFTIR